MNDLAKKLLKEYKGEYNELVKKYWKDHIVTQDELDNSNSLEFKQKYKAGDIAENWPPTLPDNPKEAYDLMVNCYAMQEFIIKKQQYLAKYEPWNLMDLKRETNGLSEFRREAGHPTVTPIEGGYDINEQAAYRNLTKGYYEEHLIDENELHLLARIYGEYILYYDFIQALSKEIYTNGHFSKLTQTEQIDKILTVICENNEYSRGLTTIDIQQILKTKNQIISEPLLNEILHKLKKDDFLRIEKENAIHNYKKLTDVDFYIATFEGRFFESVGGYAAKFSNDDAEKLKNEDEAKRVVRVDALTLQNQKRLNDLTYYLALGTIAVALIEIVKMFVELSRTEYLLSLTALYLLGSGLILGIVICLLILELNRRVKQRQA